MVQYTVVIVVGNTATSSVWGDIISDGGVFFLGERFGTQNFNNDIVKFSRMVLMMVGWLIGYFFVIMMLLVLVNRLQGRRRCHTSHSTVWVRRGCWKDSRCKWSVREMECLKLRKRQYIQDADDCMCDRHSYKPRIWDNWWSMPQTWTTQPMELFIRVDVPIKSVITLHTLLYCIHLLYILPMSHLYTWSH